ncbi:PREDICTED: CRIB domain-containing protein RIC1-like [Brassica oleracea var. oleracea]|uniref:CRIB domain-containing protein RIC1-like n=1 Tax=Brassica oleracea var. oleracea TaxID=109376 RepID=UPI0006A6CA4D|nr:PREDICTED: CRIB domain-containing protein RIC1-like [Brassica oleracea var. oleracea]
MNDTMQGTISCSWRSATTTPSWMKEHEKHQDEQKELLPPNTNEKPKQKPRRKPGPDASPNQGGNAASSEESMKQSRHNRSKQGSMDSSNDQDPSVRRRCSGGNSVKDREASTNHILLGFGIVKSRVQLYIVRLIRYCLLWA